MSKPCARIIEKSTVGGVTMNTISNEPKSVARKLVCALEVHFGKGRRKWYTSSEIERKNLRGQNNEDRYC